MKITYRTLDGEEATAYLDDEPIGTNLYKGENKWTEEPVVVRSLGEDGWIQVEGGK